MGRSAHDAFARIERVDHPAVSFVDGHVPRPPENVAGLQIVRGDFSQRFGNIVRRSRNSDPRAAPGHLREPRAIETVRPFAPPAIRFSELRFGVRDDFRNVMGRAGRLGVGLLEARWCRGGASYRSAMARARAACDDEHGTEDREKHPHVRIVARSSRRGRVFGRICPPFVELATTQSTAFASFASFV